MPLGFSFQPGQDQGNGLQDQPVRPPGQGGSSPQEAVKILNLRVPKTLPSNAPVNRALLGGPGGAMNGSSAPGAQGLTSLVQALQQAFRAQAPMGSPMQPMLPGAPQAPQTAPTFPSAGTQPTGPTFQGNVDTPPLQNAPPLDLNQTVYDYATWKQGWGGLDPYADYSASVDPYASRGWFPEAPAYNPVPSFTYADNGQGGQNWNTGDRA